MSIILRVAFKQTFVPGQVWRVSRIYPRTKLTFAQKGMLNSGDLTHIPTRKECSQRHPLVKDDHSSSHSRRAIDVKRWCELQFPECKGTLILTQRELFTQSYGWIHNQFPSTGIKCRCYHYLEFFAPQALIGFHSQNWYFQLCPCRMNNPY